VFGDLKILGFDRTLHPPDVPIQVANFPLNLQIGTAGRGGVFLLGFGLLFQKRFRGALAPGTASGHVDDVGILVGVLLSKNGKTVLQVGDFAFHIGQPLTLPLLYDGSFDRLAAQRNDLVFKDADIGFQLQLFLLRPADWRSPDT